MNMTTVVKARGALGNILSGYNCPEDMQPLLQAAHDALLAWERDPDRATDRDAAFRALAGPREEWEIG